MRVGSQISLPVVWRVWQNKKQTQQIKLPCSLYSQVRTSMIAFVSKCVAILTGRYVPQISMKVTTDKRHMHVLNIDLNAQCGTAYTCPYVAFFGPSQNRRTYASSNDTHGLSTAEAMSPSVHSHVAFDLAALSSRDALVAIAVGQQEQQQRPTARSTSGDRPPANDNGDGQH